MSTLEKVLLVVVIFFGSTSSATLDLDKCEPQFTLLATKRFPAIQDKLEEYYSRSKNYWSEVKESPLYSRIAIRNGDVEMETAENDFWGFFPKRSSDGLLLSLKFIPRFITEKFLARKLNVSNGLITTSNKALVALRKRFPEDSRLARNFPSPELSRLSVFLIEIASLGVFFHYLDLGFPHFVGELVDLRVAYQYSDLSDVLRYDYRYREIKTRLKEKKVTEFDARKGVYILNIAYRNYFDYMTSQGRKADIDEIIYRFHDHVLLSNVVELAEKGVATTNNYFAVEPGPLTRSQVEALFDLHHILYFGEQAVSDWIFQGGRTDFRGTSEDEKIILRNVLSDPFEGQLIARRDWNRLSNFELMYFIQMDLDLRRVFGEYNVLKIVPFRTRHGEPTLEFNTDTLEDLHQEILNHIDHKIDMP